ncbi:MAG TPA: 4Fe-4S dicluster domain-containing protein [Chitinophagaceae bacterium]
MEQKHSRRDFLISGLATALLAGCTKGDPFTESAAAEGVSASGEKIRLLSMDGQVIEVDKAFLKPVPDVHHVSAAEARKGIPGAKFVMVIDLSRCKNLKKCQQACAHMHHVDTGQNWVKVYPMQDAEHTAPYWQPTTCMHCDEPPCVKVCPVDATFKRQDGIVAIDSDRCVGCRFCMAACPYSSRVFNWEKPALPEEIAKLDYSPETSVPQKKGTVGKCDFCPDMIRKGELPHCVTACPNGVFFFGNMNEDSVSNGSETFRFSDLVRDKAGYRLMEDLGTKPSVYYLPPVNRNFKFEEGWETEREKLSASHDHHH